MEEDFYDAQEELAPNSTQPSPTAAAPAPGWAPPMSLNLRTQPDDVQWTAADAMAGMAWYAQPQEYTLGVPPTQMVQQVWGKDGFKPWGIPC